MSEQYVPLGQVGGQAVEQYFCPPIGVQVPIVQSPSELHEAPIEPGAASCFEPPPEVFPDPPGPPPPESPIMLPCAHAAIRAAMKPPSRTARTTRRKPITI